jgi:hypothetical protein
MFTKKGNRIISDKGFSVEQHFPRIIYREGDKTIKVEYEIFTGPFPINVYLGYPDQWEPPYENEIITESHWDQIAKNIVNAYNFQRIGITVRILEPEKVTNMKRTIKMIKEEIISKNIRNIKESEINKHLEIQYSKIPIIVAIVCLGIVLIARGIMYGLAFISGNVSFVSLAITMLLTLLVFIGLIKGHRLAWQWGRILGIFAAVILCLAAVGTALRFSDQPGMLLVVTLIALQGIPLFIMFFALGTKGAREYFRVICPECGEHKVKAGNFLFTKVICRKCNKEWS